MRRLAWATIATMATTSAPMTVYVDGDATTQHPVLANFVSMPIGARVLVERVGRQMFAYGVADPYWTVLGTSGGGVLLQSGFTNLGAPWETARFIRDAQGIVHIAGTVVAAAAHTTAGVMWTMPAGYRPLQDHGFPILTGSNLGPFGNVRVLLDGTVECYNTAAGNVFLDGITFAAEQ